MRKFGLILSGLSALIVTPALAEEELRFKYKAELARGSDKSHDVYRGNTLPMKICASGNRIIFDIWTRSLDSWSDYSLLPGECIFATPTRVTMKPSAGTLNMKVLPNVHMGRDEVLRGK